MKVTLKTKVLAASLLVLLILGGFYLYLDFKGRNEIRKFSGRLVEYGDNTVGLYGSFSSESGEVPGSLKSLRNFVFLTDSSTKFEKEVVKFPTAEQLEGADGTFDIKDLPRENSRGSLEELKQLFGEQTVFVEAYFSRSINNAKDPVASSVLYRVIPFAQ